MTANKAEVEIKRIVKEVISESSISMNRAAKKLGFTRQCLVAYKTGKRTPSLKMARRILGAYKHELFIFAIPKKIK